MEGSVIEAVAAGGSTAVLALIIFLMYRRDRKSSEDKLRQDRIFMEDRLTKLLDEDRKTREENTKATTELTILLRNMNGRKQ